MNRRGFTLLEVLVAVAILGIGLTVILSSQAGLFASSQRAANLSIATGLARCHMNEAELKLIKDGYPFVDTRDEGPCCNDETTRGFECATRVERVELPDLPDLPDTADTDPLGLSDDEGLLGGQDGLANAASQFGALGGLTDLQSQGAAALGGDPSLSGIASMLGAGENSGAGFGSMVSSLLGLVYPNLKLMLEGSIRKVTVSVTWKEGSIERDLAIVQYVTSPQQGGFDPFTDEALSNVMDNLPTTGAPGLGVGQ